MLNSLLIRNYAIIEKLELEFSDRLTIITGETGAGKSILLGALELVLGKRADTKVLFNKDQKCIVEARFTPAHGVVDDLFDEHDLEDPTEVIVRREISNKGKSRAFVNDTPVNLSVLSELSSRLLELHRQFDTLDIYKPAFQVKILDALAQNLDEVRDYRRKYDKLFSNKSRLAELKAQKVKADDETEYLQFQFDELDRLNLEELDQLAIETELSQLNNAEEIINTSAMIHRTLTVQEGSISDQILTLSNYLRKIIEYIPEGEDVSNRLDQCHEELKDLSIELERIGGSIVYNEESIQEVQQRLDELYRIQQKHRLNEITELISLRDDLGEKLKSFSDLTVDILKLKKQIQFDEIQLLEHGKKISVNRTKVAPDLKKQVEEMLSKLAMEHARLEIDIKTNEELKNNGLDSIQFLFSPNKGSSFSSIKDIASGGELSRLALCIKANVASALTLPTMIFDELDTGISGEVALKMGDIMQNLAMEHQIIAITHSPLIASKADLHFAVIKKVDGERSYTQINKLQETDRVVELAKMLGGDPPGENAVKNAKELLGI